MPMEYVDFTVQLSPGSGGAYRVLADCPLAGDVADGSFVRPFSSDELAPSLVRAVRGAAVRNLRPAPGPSLVSRSAEEIGAALFEALFNGRVRGLFDKSVGSLRGSGNRGLRLRLRLNLGAADMVLRRTFCLTVSSGDRISVVINDPKIRALEEVVTLGEGAVNNIRAMLRQHKEVAQLAS